MKKIIAYYLHEDGLAFIGTRITDAKRTDSYLIGNISDDGLKQLRQEGIVFKELKKVSKRTQDPKPSDSLEFFRMITPLNAMKASAYFSERLLNTINHVTDKSRSAVFNPTSRLISQLRLTVL